MPDFWDRVLGNSQPQQPPPPPPPSTNTPWWDRPVVNVPNRQAPTPVQPVQHEPQQDEMTEEQRAQRALERVEWTRHADRCPMCQSENYGTHPMQPRAKARCFDCGYPLVQTGSGPSIRDENVGQVPAARQISSARTNNFNARNIVLHAHDVSGDG